MPQNRDDMRKGQGKPSDNTGAAAYLEPNLIQQCVPTRESRLRTRGANKVAFIWLPMTELVLSPLECHACRVCHQPRRDRFPGTGNAIILATSGSGDRRNRDRRRPRAAYGHWVGDEQPTADVIVRVKDNDDITEQATSTAIEGCRVAQPFQYADPLELRGQGVSCGRPRQVQKEWLTDYNCDSGDAGGLPGYLLSPTRMTAQQSTGTVPTACRRPRAHARPNTSAPLLAARDCTGPAATQEERDAVRFQPTATDRFTQTECVKT